MIKIEWIKIKCRNINPKTKKVCGHKNPIIGQPFCTECGGKLHSNRVFWLVLLFVGCTIYLGIRTAIDSNKVEIIAKPSDPTQGTVIGGGVYAKDTIITITARAGDGYIFNSWDDGNKDSSRIVKTVENHKYVAIFKKVESPIDLYTGTYNPIDSINPKEPGNSTPPHSIQQEFDELCGRFDLRMKDELTYENALVLITGDYEVLNEILLMLSNNPNLIAHSENYYIERFQNRADEAIKKINDAVFSTSLDSYQGEELYSKYIPQKSKIEQIRNSL